eukprot:scaffold80807_cov36-Phaeocystis_antarctica.AAC.1
MRGSDRAAVTARQHSSTRTCKGAGAVARRRGGGGAVAAARGRKWRRGAHGAQRCCGGAGVRGCGAMEVRRRRR